MFKASMRWSLGMEEPAYFGRIDGLRVIVWI
jgi:hypothetical protein